MSMQDNVADMLTRIRNSQGAFKEKVLMPSSKLKEAIAKVLKEEGFVTDYQVLTDDSNKQQLEITLKYYQNQPVIARIKRISRPGLRTYKSAKALTKVTGFGIAILSTPKGVMPDSKARKLGIGGEVLCEVE